MKKYDIFGIGNALTDVLASITESEFLKIGLAKSSMTLVDARTQNSLLEILGNRDLELCSGGSVANSIIAAAQLGSRAAFACRLGDDRFGHFYKGEFSSLGIFLNANLAPNETTGTCISLITPDSERTMQTSLGAGSLLGVSDINFDLIRESEWVYIEGYQFANGEDARQMLREIVKHAKSCGTKVAFTFSDTFLIRGFETDVRWCATQADLVFANADEAQAFTDKTNVTDSFNELAKSFPAVVVSCGADGAIYSWQGKQQKVAAFPCKPVDLTGAGDMLSGAFLHGIIKGIEPSTALRAACLLAKHVICKVGARLHGDIKPIWNEGVI